MSAPITLDIPPDLHSELQRYCDGKDEDMAGALRRGARLLLDIELRGELEVTSKPRNLVGHRKTKR